VTFTYDEALTLPRDRVRLRIGDTNATKPLRQDETIYALVAAVGELGAIEVLATSLATEYAQRPDSLGDNGQSISWSRRVSTWLEVAARARKEMAALEGGDGDGVTSTLSAMRPVRSDVVLASEYVREPGTFSWDAPR
jgi:hypothetical protein